MFSDDLFLYVSPLTCFDYNENGQLIAQHQWKVPSKEENARNGLPETDWCDAQYDMLYLPVTESIRYHYDYYEPDAGRFINQDPIGLFGGDNVYFSVPASQNWIDTLGWAGTYGVIKCQMGGKNSKYTILAKGLSTKEGGKGAYHPLIKSLYEKIGNPLDGRNGRCSEAEILSRIAYKYKLNTEKSLMNFFKKHKCMSETFRAGEKGKIMAACVENCKPVLNFLGIKHK
jgi:rhs family protein